MCELPQQSKVNHVVASYHYAEQIYGEIHRCVYKNQEATWQQHSALLATAMFVFISMSLWPKGTVELLVAS